jgi:methylamine dehydrogenase accessory protein MauD
MDSAWRVLVIGGWVLNSLLVIVLYLLVRQVGLLSRRLPQVGARDDHQGPAVGEMAPPIDDRSVLGGKRVSLVDGRRNLIVFVSTTCEVCIELLPSLKSIARRFKDINLVIIANDAAEATRRFVEAQHLDGLQVIASRELGGGYGITYPPYAFAVDEAGIVRAKGLVNHAEHIRSLMNALSEPLDGLPSLTFASASSPVTPEMRDGLD